MRTLLLLFIQICFVHVAICQTEYSYDTTDINTIVESNSKETIFKVVEEFPRFPGCEASGLTGKQLDKCAFNRLMTFIGQNLRYPTKAQKKGIEGKVVVSFVVERDGTVSNIKLIQNIGAGCGKEVVRIVKLMNKQKIRWRPGYQRCKPVRVNFNLPVKFALT